MNNKMKLFQKLHWFSIMIGAGSILLPIFFWNQIPEEIPMHYNSAGVVDNWEQKSSLILLFFLIAFLTGMTSIAVYVVKSQMLSKYSNSDEVSMMQLVYPMLISLNVVMQSVFAYIVFCVTTARRLGTWFLPTAGILMAIPIVMLIIASMQRQTESKSVIQQYKLMEKSQKDAIAYRTAVDWWIGILLGGSVVFLMYLLIAEMIEKGKVAWMILGTVVFLLIIVIPLFFIRYVFYEEHLLVSMGIYGCVRIKYRDISGVKKTNNPLSSAAMSIRRIQIDYDENGVHRMVLISPVRRDEFIEKLNGYIEKNGD